MNKVYAKDYTEVLEIINCFPEEEYEKIPKERIEFFEKNKDSDYNFKIDPNIDLSNQNISQNANAIIVSLFLDYFATDEQKEVLQKMLENNQKKIEEEKNKKYNYNNIFEEKNYKNDRNNKIDSQKEEESLIEVKKTKWYTKIFDIFKNILKK